MIKSKLKAAWTVAGFLVAAAMIVWTFLPEPEDPEKRQMAAICSNLVTPCYAAAGAWGNISGSVVVDVAEDGKVERSRYRGSAPAPVEQCLVQTTKARAIDDYSDVPLRITCQYSGSLTEGTQMLSTNWKLDRR